MTGKPWFSGKQSICQCRRPWFDPWSGRIPWRRKWQPTPVFLPGKPKDRGARQATVHGVTKNWSWPRDWATTIGMKQDDLWTWLNERKWIKVWFTSWFQGCLWNFCQTTCMNSQHNALVANFWKMVWTVLSEYILVFFALYILTHQ